MINKNHFNYFPVLESERLIFRQFNIKDADLIYKLRTNQKVMSFMDNYKHTSLKDSKNFIQKNNTIYANKKGIFWLIELKSTHEKIGDFAFWNINHQHKRGEIGYALLPEYWGKGYMTETLKTILKFGFEELNLHSIEANINPKNDNSRQLLNRIGFKKEAYFKENYYFDGKFIDSEIYSLLESDFNQSQN